MADRTRRLSAVFLAGFLLIAVALGYWQVLRADDVLERIPNNPRVVERERAIHRGRIVDRVGAPLAWTEERGGVLRRIYASVDAAHVTGYASTRLGKTGVEGAMDRYLGGERSASALRTLRQKIIPSTVEGTDVHLTIDHRLQSAAHRELSGSRGAILVVQVATGDVLAMASQPTFDPNRIEEQWAELLANPDAPLVNRATQGQYPPGSVFKLITAAAGLDIGAVEPSQRHRHDADLVVDGFRIRNSNHPQLTELSFAEEFAWSCNPAFGLLGLSLGLPGGVDWSGLHGPEDYTWTQGAPVASVERLRDYASRFWIGEPVPFLLPVAGGRLWTDSVPSGALLASTAFGQGELLVSPMHIVLAAAATANGGLVSMPRLVLGIGDTEPLAQGPSVGPAHRVAGNAAARALSDMMVLSAETAYASPARIPGVVVAGKTGTAEVGSGQTPHSWFVGFAPATRAGVAIAVIKENQGSGTQHATPAAQRVLQEALRLGY